MNKTKILTIGLAVLLFAIVAGLVIYNFFMLVHVARYEMSYDVVEERVAGINVEPNLNFSKGSPGAGKTKKLTMSNHYGFATKVDIRVTGDIAEFITVSDNEFVLEPGETKTINFNLDTKDSTPYGHYSGETIVFFKRKLI